MARIDEVEGELRLNPKRWLVTGAAGFIGSNIVDRLISLGQTVVGLDNFSTGHRRNLELALLAPELFKLLEGDIRDLETCRHACTAVDYVLHQAALGSVPRSMKDPLATHAVNVDGTVNMLLAARDAGAKRFVFASSSSVYGDDQTLPKIEDRVGNPLSPYAVSKKVCEVYAKIYSDCFGLETVGLRYFNVFGPRQDPNGPYAAVVAKWLALVFSHQDCELTGSPTISRDFTFVQNAVDANILAATAHLGEPHRIFNVACERETTLAELFALLRREAMRFDTSLDTVTLKAAAARPGDISQSLAATTRGRQELGYHPRWPIEVGIAATAEHFLTAGFATAHQLPQEKHRASA